MTIPGARDVLLVQLRLLRLSSLDKSGYRVFERLADVGAILKSIGGVGMHHASVDEVLEQKGAEVRIVSMTEDRLEHVAQAENVGALGRMFALEELRRADRAYVCSRMASILVEVGTAPV